MASFLTNEQTYPKNLDKKKKEGTSLNHENPNPWWGGGYTYSSNYKINILPTKFSFFKNNEIPNPGGGGPGYIM